MRRIKLRRWTVEEENRMLEALQTYMGNEHWARGQKELAWQAVASEVGRSVGACRIRFHELKIGFRKPLQERMHGHSRD